MYTNCINLTSVKMYKLADRDSCDVVLMILSILRSVM
jgi:hypothetical protein